MHGIIFFTATGGKAGLCKNAKKTIKKVENKTKTIP
jgi:hypothetical protein